MANHETYMSLALQLAKRGLFTTHPNPRVGCVIVKNNHIVGEGWHHIAGGAHAEVNAVLNAGEQTRNAECYVTLEPCSHFGRTPPCATLLIESGIRHVIIAMMDPNPLVSGRGIELLEAAGIKVTVGVLQAQSEALNIGFCKRMQTGRPYVRSKLAMSVDGKTAMSSGQSKWITGADARQDVQKLRAQSAAIMTGTGTVLADDPSLTVRIDEGADWYHHEQAICQPLRIIVGNTDTPEYAQLFDDVGSTLKVTTQQTELGHYDEVLIVPEKKGHVDLNSMMDELGRREINEILVEAGSVLNGALLELGLIDELIIYIAPKLMGDTAKGLFHLPELHTMAQNIELDITDIRSVGKDWRMTAIPQNKVV